MDMKWNAVQVMTIRMLSMIHFTEKISPWDYKIKAHILMEMHIALPWSY